MKKIFENIIQNHCWQDVVCGSGSTLEYTKPLRDSLPNFLSKHNITSMFDAPCGDYSWMSLVEFKSGFKYIGGDIVEFMINSNRSTYPGVEFTVFDISQDAIPDVDLLFCRDCLFHFSQEDIDQTFDNILKSNVQYILTTSYINGSNHNIITGNFRELDFIKPPFNFDLPIGTINDWIPGYAPRQMCLWHRSTIEKYKQ
jgi:hypothetical protein